MAISPIAASLAGYQRFDAATSLPGCETLDNLIAPKITDMRIIREIDDRRV